MVKAIPLYLARSINELHDQLGRSRRSNSSLTLEQLEATYRTIENNAKQHLESEGDRELAYLTYCRALEYLNLIRSCQDYTQQSQTFQETYERNYLSCEQVICALRLELQDRYEELTPDHTCQNEEDHGFLPARIRPEYDPMRQLEMPAIQSLRLTPIVPQRECAVCSETKPLTEFDTIFSQACQHEQRQVCNTCVLDHVKSVLSDRTVTKVSCPEAACDAYFEFDTIRKILADAATFVNQFEDRLSAEYIERMQNFVWCAHGCGWGCQLDIEDGPVFRCRRCKQRTCSVHRVKWHLGMTCEQYDQKLRSDQEEIENQGWLKDHTKQCPGCHAPIEKNLGCDHMTCRHCKHEFCWICGAEWKRIAEEGNQHHLPTCHHYLRRRRLEQ